MRTKTEIIKELNEANSVCDKLTMDIGQGYARFRLTNDSSIVANVNLKIEALKKAEVLLRQLEQELANTTE